MTPWIAARQASLSITNSRNSLRLTSIKLVMPSSHLILGCPLLLLHPIPPSIRVFSNESTLRMREMQTKVMMNTTSHRLGWIKETDNNKCWQRWEKIGTFTHCCWDLKMVQSLPENSLAVPQNVKQRTAIWDQFHSKELKFHLKEIKTYAHTKISTSS